MNTNSILDQDAKKRTRKDRREEILKAASTLFGSYGFQNTPLSLIAQTVGISEPGVLHYFPSKVHLLQGVLDYQEQRGDEKYSKLFGPDENVLVRFLEVLEDNLAENRKDPTLARFFTVLVGESIQKDHPGHDVFVNRYERIRQMIIKELENRPGASLVSDTNMYELMSLTLAVFDGLQIQWLLAPEKVDTVAAFNLFSKMLLGYVQKNSSPQNSEEPASDQCSDS